MKNPNLTELENCLCRGNHCAGFNEGTLEDIAKMAFDYVVAHEENEVKAIRNREGASEQARHIGSYMKGKRLLQLLINATVKEALDAVTNDPSAKLSDIATGIFDRATEKFGV